MAGQRSLNSNVGGLLISNLADEHHIRVCTKDRTQSRGERHTGLVVHLNLIDASHTEFHRVLNRNKDIIRTWWDPFTLKAPVFGKLDTNVALARFCNNFSSMLASGVPILQALDIVGSTSGNYVIDSSSKRVGRLVERGYRLADSMSTEKIFPNMLVQMVSIGEDSGAIDKMLSSAGRAYDEEAQSMAKQLTSLLEPLMILFLGVVVGFMVVALYMPMFSMFDAINGQA